MVMRVIYTRGKRYRPRPGQPATNSENICASPLYFEAIAMIVC
jgi:hypothetical protein